MTNRQKQAMETKKLLIRKGRKYLAENGTQAFRIDDFVKECSVSKGTFYHYFPSKDEFIFSIMEFPYMELREEVNARMQEDIVDQIRWFAVEHTRFLVEFGTDFTAHFYAGAFNGTISTSSHVESDYLMEIFTLILGKGVESGKLRKDTPVEQLSQIFSACLRGRSVTWCLSPEKVDPMELTGQIFREMMEPCLSKYVVKV
ncbi:MAG: TetR/AcrR family transcriptional regulator [Lachnospiraceae bacterium]|nr:TetR/AcrR family transcriptional regulator [Lachnospiraceae bacterium]